MRDSRCLLTLILVAICNIGAIAQGENAEEGHSPLSVYDAYAEIRSAIDSLNACNKKNDIEIDALNKQIARDTLRLIKEQNERLKKLEASRKQVLKKYEKEIEDTVKKLEDGMKTVRQQLKKIEGKMYEDTISKLEQLQIDSAVLVLDNEKLEKTLKDAESELAAVKTELADLRKFCAQYIASSAQKVDNWTKLRFSQMNADDLKSLADACLRYQTADDEFKQIGGRIKILLNHKKLYEEGLSALESVYDADVVRLSADLNKVIPNYAGKPQYQELKSIAALLDGYGESVAKFQEVINTVNSDVEGYEDDPNFASIIVGDALSKLQENITDIEKIPFLKKRFAQYRNELKKSPLKKSSVEDEILGIKINKR